MYWSKSAAANAEYLLFIQGSFIDTIGLNYMSGSTAEWME